MLLVPQHDNRSVVPIAERPREVVKQACIAARHAGAGILWQQQIGPPAAQGSRTQKEHSNHRPRQYVNEPSDAHVGDEVVTAIPRFSDSEQGV